MLQVPLGETVRVVRLTEIDAEDRVFLHSFPERPPQELVESVAVAGVVQPLVVQPTGPARHRIVSGFRRFWAATEAGLTAVPVRSLTATDLSKIDLLRWAGLENAGHRRLNRVEQALLLSRLKQLGLTELNQLLAFSVSIGGPTTEEQLSRLLTLLELEVGFLELAAQNRLPDETIEALLQLTTNERQAILRVVHALHLSFSRFRELVRLGTDVARREEKSLTELLHEPVFSRVLADSKLTSSQKTERFFRQLKERRYPRLSAAESRFDALRRRLRLPPRSRLEHSPSFETPELSLELRFTSARQFRQTVRSLQRLQEDPTLLELFELLEQRPQDRADDGKS